MILFGVAVDVATGRIDTRDRISEDSVSHDYLKVFQNKHDNLSETVPHATLTRQYAVIDNLRLARLDPHKR